MKIFISWSGDQGKKIGEAIKEWIPDVIQSTETFYSPDIEKGERWSEQIKENLKNSQLGIICITQESKTAPWLMFEAGAISNAQLSRVCPLLFGVEPTQLTGPLSQFQATPYNEDEIRKLIESINEKIPSPLSSQQLSKSFENWWPRLEEKIESILKQDNQEKQREKRPQIEMIEEILSTVRNLAIKSPTDDSSNHWIVLFRSLLDFGKMIDKSANSQSTEAEVEIEMLKLVHNHLRLTLNLCQPKIEHFSKYKELMAEAKSLMSTIERTIQFKEIPF